MHFTVNQFPLIDYFQARRDKEVIKNRVKALLGLPQKWKPRADVEVSNIFSSILSISDHSITIHTGTFRKITILFLNHF
jgi:hypothetical protein